MLAVGGGGPRDVRPLFGRWGLFNGDIKEPARARESMSLDFLGLEGVTPPYFSRRCWVELYFVAALSLSIVVLLCKTRASR